MTPESRPFISLNAVSKSFGRVDALKEVDIAVSPGEVHCLLGDNGAGKSTLIKIMSGVHRPSRGDIWIEGERTSLNSPRDAQDVGIAAVHQEVGVFPLMSVARNFFVGREPRKGHGPFRRLDRQGAGEIAVEQLRAMGIRRVTSGDQLVGTLSGGERQALAIGRALYFGARMLILDEPTSALGVKEAAIVLRLMQQARSQGIAIVFITHNAHHAMSIGDKFSVLIHGRVADHFARGERSKSELLDLMAGGEDLEALEVELRKAESARGDGPL
jgi:simple sugar transport system ATP-binding protein